jgi:hypothetical protein
LLQLLDMPFHPTSSLLASSGPSTLVTAAQAPGQDATPSHLASPWRLRLLGSFSLERDGERVCGFGARLDEQLLAYLALHSPTNVARRDLVALFWPHIATSTALKNLSVTLFAIRKRLQDEGMPADTIDGARQSLRLVPLLAVDLQHFLRALARAARATHKADRDHALEEAIDLYGAGLLPDMHAGWLTPHQQRYHQLYRIAVDLLSSPDRHPQLLAQLRDTLPPIAWQLAGGEPAQVSDAAASPDAPPEASTPVPPDPQATLDPQLLTFCVEAGTELVGPQAQECVQRVEARLPEIRAAADQALAQGRPDLAAQLIVPIWRFWRLRGADAAGYAILQPILQAVPKPTGESGARLLHATGTLAAYAGRFQEADALLEAAVGEWRELRDLDGLFRSLANQAINQYNHGDAAKALELFRQSIRLARAMAGDQYMVSLYHDAALAALRIRDAEAARGYLQRRLLLLQDRPQSERLVGETYAHLAAVDLLEDDLAAAEAHVAQAQDTIDSHGLPADKLLLDQLRGRIAYLGGRLPQAQQHMEAALATARASKLPGFIGTSLGFLAVVLEAQGQSAAAEEMMDDAAQVFELVADAGAMARFQAELAQLRDSAAAQASRVPD